MSEFPSIHQDDLTLVQNKSGIRVLKINQSSVDQRLTGEILDNIVMRKTNEKFKIEPDTIGLEKLGWRKIGKSVWCWQEPKTRALYKVQDALDLVASQAKNKQEKEMTDFPDFRKDAEKLIEIRRLSNEVAGEVMRATSLFAPINGPHEGYGVIKEEFDEFWDEVKKYNLNKNRDTRPQMRAELIQLAAMCLRTIHDVIDK